MDKTVKNKWHETVDKNKVFSLDICVAGISLCVKASNQCIYFLLYVI